ncbi:hypothetical protein DER45DRAFT_69086 [Fusarium avenaceum]|nr:hypothetical protein DER45DRAFT_69086 [Fusarium avenaceum]
MVLGMVLAHRLIRRRANPLASPVRALTLWYSLPLTLTIIIPTLLRQDAETRRWFARAWSQRTRLEMPDPNPPKSKGLTSGPHHHPCSTHLGSPAFCGCSLMTPAQSRELKRGVVAQFVLTPTPVSLNI